MLKLRNGDDNFSPLSFLHSLLSYLLFCLLNSSVTFLLFFGIKGKKVDLCMDGEELLVIGVDQKERD